MQQPHRPSAVIQLTLDKGDEYIMKAVHCAGPEELRRALTQWGDSYDPEQAKDPRGIRRWPAA